MDVGHLLRIPEDIVLPKEPEDEFECLNLDVCVPAGLRGPVPVMIWIHGQLPLGPACKRDAPFDNGV